MLWQRPCPWHLRTEFLARKGCVWHLSLGTMCRSCAAAAKWLQSCPTLCDPWDGSPPGSPVPGILQERILEWVAISFSNAWKWKVKGKSFSRVRLLAAPWTAAYQAPPSMGFSRQEYWTGVQLPTPRSCAQHSIQDGSSMPCTDAVPGTGAGAWAAQLCHL